MQSVLVATMLMGAAAQVYSPYGYALPVAPGVAASAQPTLLSAGGFAAAAPRANTFYGGYTSPAVNAYESQMPPALQKRPRGRYQLGDSVFGGLGNGDNLLAYALMGTNENLADNRLLQYATYGSEFGMLGNPYLMYSMFAGEGDVSESMGRYAQMTALGFGGTSGGLGNSAQNNMLMYSLLGGSGDEGVFSSLTGNSNLLALSMMGGNTGGLFNNNRNPAMNYAMLSNGGMDLEANDWLLYSMF